ncbi:Detected protein of unknown function [Hibiscus syriacus]|uniref:Neprosin PEP catalytic domain-containing protein n=1 Tax=Hibiscus syriacus TaxID=106335 RepID=A0A6A3B1M1_HIBSY|nr:uncharacterized protein LOC120117221 [Hibiscus syriacus]KAE8710840.1 Detected protein of unknown function [Hibiscus syriacus]
MFGRSHPVQEWQTMSEEENLEMERLLNVINKPTIKSFKTDYGDILDCIDIYKQHAFDHPLLKDHKVQMRPKNIPKSMMEGESPRLLPEHIKCPPGSVLIKRTTKEDLIMANKLEALGLNYPSTSHLHQAPAKSGHAFATLHYYRHNFGARTIMNVWRPKTLSDQASLASLWISSGPLNNLNVIQAGWGVEPQLFSSNYTRLYARWTVDNYKATGCFNYLCPGFVQVHRQISLGLVLNQISVYNGKQIDIDIAILRDGEWWLKLFNQFIGYWPQKLFFYMYGGANNVIWGGQVISPTNKPSPSMGSGHFPKHGLQNKSAYFRQTQIWDNVHLIYPRSDRLQLVSSLPACYEAVVTHGVAPNSIDLYYGGPGQCKI